MSVSLFSSSLITLIKGLNRIFICIYFNKILQKYNLKRARGEKKLKQKKKKKKVGGRGLTY